MIPRRLFYQLLPSYLLLTLATLVGVGWFSIRSAERTLLDCLREDLASKAQYIATTIGSDIPSADPALLRDACQSVSALSGARFTILDSQARILADSQNKPEQLAGLTTSPEVASALHGETSSNLRTDPNREGRTLSLAIPIQKQGHTTGAILASQSTASIDRSLPSLLRQIALFGLAIILLSIFISWWVSGLITRPIQELQQAILHFARGDLSRKLPTSPSAELASLTDSLQQMASQLQQRINSILLQSNEQKAVIRSMNEGVLAVDHQQRIISMNKATCQLLDIDPDQAPGRKLQEVVRNADLCRFVTRTLASRQAIDSDVVLHGASETVLQARGSALYDAHDQPIGAVVVLNDVTEFRRLEHIRRDFVANVSHELKTPVTSIKGFIETLLDGAVHNPDDAQRFLQIAAKQADRLSTIIDDLLSLSRIEQSAESSAIALENHSLHNLLRAALHECAAHAAEHQIQVRLDCDCQLSAHINAPLLEQAVINLLDNAIKYSDPGREVQVVGNQTADGLTIAVIDHGSGISAEHLPRIFERFYRVDKARSRKLGGTGLGLAIVKHIVQAHGGRVTVKSTLGHGSTFTILLPPH